MKNENPEPLEQYIEAELHRLALVKAPPGLADKVMDRIRRERAPWWQAGWAHWPWSLRLAAILVVGTLGLNCARSISELGVGWTATILADEALSSARAAWNWLGAAEQYTRTFRSLVQLNLAVLLIVTPLALVAGRTVLTLTLKDEK